MQSSAEEISSLLHAWCDGDRTALDKLIPLVYEELRRIAHRYMRHERANHTLQTTALVHEAFLQLVKAQQIEWKDRTHFFAISAKLMRRILVDIARSHGSRKRGGEMAQVPLDSDLPVFSGHDTDLVELDAALNALAGFDARKAKVVELRFFGGLSEREAAEVLGVSLNTVKRDWGMAKVWLHCELKDRE
ncbi:MAG: sigma-70 family RNA polymerase sigma factor [Acidobacteria bacterium]|nr:sigma-70 family RNA polymerase sigma factor [Acidobacteriota bacterium]